MSSGPPIEAAGAALFDGEGRILLIKENYGRERWGFPGGAVEAGETLEETVVREVREETGLEIRVEGRVGSYALADSTLTAHLFRCTIVAGTPAVPPGGEIADVRWWPPDALPWPQTNLLYHALRDAIRGLLDVERRNLPRVT